MIDLTMTYEESMQGVSFETARTYEHDGWNARLLHLYSHAGTHMDAPIHFGIDGPTIDKIPIEDCVGTAWVVDLSGIAPNAVIEVAALGKVADLLQPGESIILKTGWSKYLESSEYRDSLPRIGEEFAEWCVQHGVKMLAVEPPSVADVNNLEEVTKIHHILLRGGIIIIEGLTGLEALKQEKVTLMAFPLKIKNGDGAPARVIAIEHH